MIAIFTRILRPILCLISLGAGATLITASGIFLYLSPKLPSVETLKDIQLQTPLQVFSADGKLLGEFGEMRREPLAYEDLSPLMVQAFIAAEDGDFFNHHGVDAMGLLRAASELLTSRQIQTGGSTITMQVARNFFLSSEQTFIRKFNEILLAFRIEKKLSKEEILTLYVNKIFLGHRAYGVGAAASVYYGKPVADLDLAEIAMIAGLPKAPSAYNPLSNPARALERRNWILRRMHRLGYIDTQQMNAAAARPNSASYHGFQLELSAPYVAEMARREALELFGDEAYTAGYRLYTTVDSELQEAARRALMAGVESYDLRHGYRGAERNIAAPSEWDSTLRSTRVIAGMHPAIVTEVGEQTLTLLLPSGEQQTLLWDQGMQGLRLYRTVNARSAPIRTAAEAFSVGDLIRVRLVEDSAQLAQLPDVQAALVAMDPQDGALRALIGGYDFGLSNFNRATQAERQPGSSFKPFIYAAALEHGMSPATLINDAPVVYEDPELLNSWRPANDTGRFYGPTRLREALYRSRNLVSIRILSAVGIAPTIHSLDRYGFDTENVTPNLSLALGSHAMPPLDVTRGFTLFANGGYLVDPYLISRVENRQGVVVHQHRPATACPQCLEQTGRLASAEIDGGMELALPMTPGDLPMLVPAPQVMDERVAYLMDSILKDVVVRGTGQRARALGRQDIGGKTGTTNGPRDAWFAGYSPHLVASTWVGFDDYRELGRSEFGSTTALPIWIDFMEEALAGLTDTSQPQPLGIVSARIDPATGLRVPPGYPGAIFELFLQENLPPMDNSWKPGRQESGSDSPLQAEDLF